MINENIFNNNSFITLCKKTDITKDKTLDVIIHQCNCFHVMGGGVALALRKKWKAVHEADLCTIKGDKCKLGTYSCACISDDDHEELFVFNLYSQYSFGNGLDTNYIAMRKGLYDIFNMLSNSSPNGHKIWNVGIPYLIGCGLAGGDPTVVLNIIVDVYKEVNPKNIIIKFDDIN